MFAKLGKRWLLVVVGLPVAAWLLDRTADRMEQRKGGSDVTQGMHGVADRLRRFRRAGGAEQRHPSNDSTSPAWPRW